MRREMPYAYAIRQDGNLFYMTVKVARAAVSFEQNPGKRTPDRKKHNSCVDVDNTMNLVIYEVNTRKSERKPRSASRSLPPQAAYGLGDDLQSSSSQIDVCSHQNNIGNTTYQRLTLVLVHWSLEALSLFLSHTCVDLPSN